MEWISLVTTFLQPIILKCFQRTSAEDPQEFLRENFNPVTGRMDPDVVEDAIPATRKAARKAERSLPKEEKKKIPRHTREDWRQLAEQALIASMNAPPERVAAVRAEAEAMID